MEDGTRSHAFSEFTLLLKVYLSQQTVNCKDYLMADEFEVL